MYTYIGILLTKASVSCLEVNTPHHSVWSMKINECSILVNSQIWTLTQVWLTLFLSLFQNDGRVLFDGVKSWCKFMLRFNVFLPWGSYIFKESFCEFNQLVYDGNNLSASGCLGNFVMSWPLWLGNVNWCFSNSCYHVHSVGSLLFIVRRAKEFDSLV